MGVQLDLFPLSTIEGFVNAVVEQEIAQSVDTSRHFPGVVSMRVLAAHLCAIAVEGSDDGQNFVTIDSAGTVGFRNPVYLNREQKPGSTTRLYKYLRWSVTPTDVDWYFCGRISVALK